MKHNESFDVGGWLGGWFQTQDDVETKLYGLRPFEAHGAPRNNSEAAERSMCAARTSTTHAPRTPTSCAEEAARAYIYAPRIIYVHRVADMRCSTSRARTAAVHCTATSPR